MIKNINLQKISNDASQTSFRFLSFSTHDKKTMQLAKQIAQSLSKIAKLRFDFIAV